MNTVMLAGNLASDVTVRPLANDKHVGRFTLAVDRGYKRDAGTDFYRVTVWNGAATNAEKHLHKGDAVIVRGHLRTSSYEKRAMGAARRTRCG